jgi:hypothetical protein
MHVQPIIKICNAKQARQIYQYKKRRNLCIKLEINQGYTIMHVQPIIKICNASTSKTDIPIQKDKKFVHQFGDQPTLYYDARSTNRQDTDTELSRIALS